MKWVDEAHKHIGQKEVKGSASNEWIVWRDAIRQTAKDTVTAINACVDVDGIEAVIANVVWANDPSYVVE